MNQQTTDRKTNQTPDSRKNYNKTNFVNKNRLNSKSILETYFNLGYVIYHHPTKGEHKLAADYNTSGIVKAKWFGSVDVELNNGRIITSSLENVKKFSFKRGKSVGPSS
ncbi:hypothetical protein NGRA_1016 [Nosema granulosis]|uniref:Uncharacterized protein n=1 Tax=Nosema granulosis TaxID=83296 RepID=A0A9P6KZ20_9MICR|nr:hypothetical protein NGRA_1016 [Nosema granulosis]